MLADLFDKGGTPRKLLSLAQRAGGAEHHFLVFNEHPENLECEMAAAGALLIRSERRRSWDLRLLGDILSAVKRHRIEVINTHFARADVYGVVAGKLAGVPVVKSVHGIAWNESPLLRRIDGFLSGFRARTVCNSRATQRAVERQTGARNCTVIYNGVADEGWRSGPQARRNARAMLGIADEVFAIGHVGGLVRLRRQDVLLAALGNLHRFPGHCHCFIVGDGPHRGELLRTAESLGVSGAVTFLGYRRDVRELLPAFDAYVNMADEEGFGLACVEAMLAGIPVVLADAGALPELIKPGKSGLLVAPGDAVGLARVLVDLAKDRDGARALGLAGREDALAGFSITRFVEEYEMLYAEVVAQGRREGTP